LNFLELIKFKKAPDKSGVRIKHIKNTLPFHIGAIAYQSTFFRSWSSATQARGLDYKQFLFDEGDHHYWG